MTPEEAIEIIWERHMDCEDYRFQFDDYPDGYDFEFDQAILMAAQALEEIQKYREIGTLEECLEAVEKQKPKKPKEILRHRGGFEMQHCPKCDTDYQVDRRYKIKDGYCPACGKLLDSAFRNYCANCGQAIDEKLEGTEDEQD